MSTRTWPQPPGDGLYRAGLKPAVITRDGLEGYRPGAPFDRIIATCGLRTIPSTWVEQVKPGGIIVAPWVRRSAARTPWCG
ncbi:protein-L-isoaspartate O-methyltransferase family protein [Streptomyces synnematoformans]